MLRRAVVLLSLAAAGLAAQPHPVIVSAKWLEKRLNDRGVVVLHSGTKTEYDAGHLPGARFLPFTAVALQSDGLSTQLPSPAYIDSLVESVGVSDGQHIVVYGQPLVAARTLVTLERVGLRGKVSLLDGGIDAWRESGRPVSFDPTPVTRGSFTPQPFDNVVDAAWITQNQARAGIRVLDARAPEFHLGLSAGSTARAGRIPGARNIPFSSLTSELTTFRDAGKIRRLFEQAGVMKGDTVVTYCHIGLQASLLYTAARSLGIPVRIYDGSFEDWAKRSELPVEKVR
ncbi:MAG: sulfurtransferase [Gemmatimonadetes bacterium]|nr:sulfurtransferase [Gemmatimonadota bacterium]